MILNVLQRRVRDSNPRYDVMRTPHFECGSFDHSDNSPRYQRKAGAKVLLFFDIRKRLRNFFAILVRFRLNFVKSGPEYASNIGIGYERIGVYFVHNAQHT